MTAVGQERLPLPEDMSTARLDAARRERGLSYDDVSNALGVSKNTVANWMTGRRVPRVRFHDALRLLLYGIDPGPRDVWLRHRGREYRGTVTGVGGRGAWVRFTYRSGREGHKYVLPNERAVYLGGDWVYLAVSRRTLGPLGPLVDRLRAGATVRLDAEDFETQALANTLDRMAGRTAVDRGGLAVPENLLAR